MKKKNDVVTVVVTYNRKKLLKENIQSLQKQKYKENLILIIDNNSSDGTYEYIKNLLNDNTIYINTGANLGGAGGFNFGIKKAMEYNPKNIWVMDDDTIPNENSLLELVNAATMLNDKFSFLSSRVLWKDGKICKINKQVFDNNMIDTQELINKGILKVKSASFVSCFINTKAIKKVGLPIKEFFIWGDDVEYTERLSKYESAYYINNSVVIHKSVENKLPCIEEDVRDLSRFEYLYRNLYYIYKKEGKLKRFKTLKRKHISNIIRKAKNKKIKRIMIILKGELKGKRFNPKIEYI